jgi:uncharacterized phage protein (TIGR01671 family)
MLGFRVWDTNINEFLPNEEFWCDHNGVLWFDRGYDAPIHPDIYKIGGKTLENFKFMQSTGLKDCNDKEIYESDILLAEFSYLPSKYIKVESACFFWKWLGMIQPNDYKLTVLGNRFENPELLEKIK